MSALWISSTAVFPSAARSIVALIVVVVFVAACPDRAFPLSDATSEDTSTGVFTGEWIGHIESFTFPSGSDRLQISIPTLPSLSVVFGVGAPPLIDKDIGYPATNAEMAIIEGFPFAGRDAKVAGVRLTFKMYRAQQWDSWCKLQRSYPWGPGDYFCLPNAAIGVTDDGSSCWYQVGSEPKQYVDCVKLSLCGGGQHFCRCDASMCFGGDDMPVDFDLHLTQDTLSGSVQLPYGLRNVHLERN